MIVKGDNIIERILRALVNTEAASGANFVEVGLSASEFPKHLTDLLRKEKICDTKSVVA